MEEIEIEGIKYNVELINEKDSNDTKTYKVIIIGKMGVGKSSNINFILYINIIKYY